MKRREKGQSLVEMVMALAVITIVLFALTRTVILSLKNMDFSKSKNYALNLAQTKMEEIRKERDANDWAKFKTSATALAVAVRDPSGVYMITTSVYDCKPDPPNPLPLKCSGVEAEKLLVDVIVTWTDPKGLRQASVSGYFVDFR